MLKIHDWLLIREYLAQGNSINHVAKLTGHDRKTIQKVAKIDYPFKYDLNK